MKPFDSLSLAAMGVYASGFLIVCVLSIAILVMVIMLRARKRVLAISISLVAVSMFTLQCLVDITGHIYFHHELNAVAGSFAKLPCGIVLAILLLSACIVIFCLVLILRKKKRVITPSAVKESLDTLPDGICFSDEEGRPLLVNLCMNRISGDLFGQEILSSTIFWESLGQGVFLNEAKLLRTSPAITVQNTDGKVWDFRRRKLLIDNCWFYEITALDVTELHDLNIELTKRNAILDEVNRRLHNYSREIEKVTAEKELLAAKMRVHDDLGRALLAYRSRYLSAPAEKRDRKQLLALWRRTIAVMRGEARSEKGRSDWELLQQAAQAVDVEMILDDSLPKEGSAREILIAAVHECLTNTVKHAHGHRLQIAVTTENGVMKADITNDGEQPSEIIRETGGLKNLRMTLEQAGGRMEIQSVPNFLLHIETGEGETGRCRKPE